MTDSGRNRHLWNSSAQRKYYLEDYAEVASISWPVFHTIPLHSTASLGHKHLPAEQSQMTLEENAE